MKPICNGIYQENYNCKILDLKEDLQGLIPDEECETLEKLILEVYKEGLLDGIKLTEWLYG